MKPNRYELMTDEELENCVIPNTEHRFRMWQKEYWKRFGDGVTIEYEDEIIGQPNTLQTI